MRYGGDSGERRGNYRNRAWRHAPFACVLIPTCVASERIVRRTRLAIRVLALTRERSRPREGELSNACGNLEGASAILDGGSAEVAGRSREAVASTSERLGASVEMRSQPN